MSLFWQTLEIQFDNIYNIDKSILQLDEFQITEMLLYGDISHILINHRYVVNSLVEYIVSFE